MQCDCKKTNATGMTTGTTFDFATRNLVWNRSPGGNAVTCFRNFPPDNTRSTFVREAREDTSGSVGSPARWKEYTAALDTARSGLQRFSSEVSVVADTN